MSAPQALLKATNRIVTLVTFWWGAGPTFARYAGFTQDVVVGGNTFSALPGIEVKYGEEHGGTEDTPPVIRMRQNVSPIDKMLVKRFTPTRFRIEEVDLDDPDLALRTMFIGRVARARPNAKGRAGVAELITFGAKALLDIPLGVMADKTCAWVFGNENNSPCGKDLAAISMTGTLASVDGLVATVTGLSGSPGWSDYFAHGRIRFDGYDIRILAWNSSTPTKFPLARFIPDHWIGQTVTLIPGCAKIPEACDRWGRLESFRAMGIAMKPRHPQFESEGDPEADS